MSKRIINSFQCAIDQAIDGYGKTSISEKHGAVVVSGGKVIGGGYNSTNTFPFPWISGSSKFTHAEPAALLDYAGHKFSSFRGRRIQYFEKRRKDSPQDVRRRIRCTNPYIPNRRKDMQFKAMQ